MATIIKSYEDLKVWQRSVNLARHVYELTRDFPREEVYGLRSQMRRSAVSVPSNIAEGQARQHCKEFIQFLYHSLGSLAELDTQAIIATEIGYLPQPSLSSVRQAIAEIRKMIHGLIRSLTSD